MIRAGLGLLPLCTGTLARADDLARPARPGESVDLLQWGLAMAVVLAAIVGLAWLMRRLGRFSHIQSGRFRVLAALPVGPRERVVLVQAGDKQLVLGVAPGQVRTLCVLEGSELIGASESVAEPPAPESFSARINELLSRGPQ
jgi:flagellar protein FliO/FliZ